MAQLGYYAHAHGSGHCRYADYFNELAGGTIPVFTSRDFSFAHTRQVIKLASDLVPDAEREKYALPPPRYLHYAPVGYAPIQRRSLTVLNAIRKFKLNIVIVDVSVEIAAFLRSSSVPYVYRRMPGDRSDLAHREAYRGAVGLIAYYPETMEASDTPEWVRDKTTYLGFKPETSTDKAADYSIREWWNIPAGMPIISVVTGFGGAGEVDGSLPRIRRSYPDHFILGLGHFAESSHDFFDKNVGILPDISPYLKQSDIIVGACGSNLVTEALRSGTPFVPIPCTRPHDEQRLIADSLYHQGLCTSIEDFLAGTTPIRMSADKRAEMMQNQYKPYFDRLMAADGWRAALPVSGQLSGVAV